jgi:hypothetical protein
MCNLQAHGSNLLQCMAQMEVQMGVEFTGSCAVAKIGIAIGGTRRGSPSFHKRCGTTTRLEFCISFVECCGICVRDCSGKPGVGQACVLQAGGGDNRSLRAADKTLPVPRGLAAESPTRRDTPKEINQVKFRSEWHQPVACGPRKMQGKCR